MKAAETPVVDFDHHAPATERHPYDTLTELREQHSVAWSERHGGFWVVTGYADVRRVLSEYETFSSARLLEQDVTSFHVPPKRLPYGIPNELDPPESIIYRRMINPLLSPAAAEGLAPRMEHWTTVCIDRVIEQGECDLIYDFATPVPAAVSLEWIGLPETDFPRISNAYHDLLGNPPGEPLFERALEDLEWMYGRVREELLVRREDPRDDVMSYLLAQTIDGEPLPLDVVFSMTTLLIAGGVDTVTTAIAWAMLHLNRFLDHRTMLAADPELWETATEELLRRYPPVISHGRIARHDAELGGCPVRAGDRVLAFEGSACHDATVFVNPEEVVLDRFPNRHLAFGIGTHRCVGMHFARRLYRVMMTQLLERMPDYRIDESRASPYKDSSAVAGWVSLPATFTPGKPRGQ